MAGNFVLRNENDPNNPFAARLYGKGLTGGRTVFYLNAGEDTRTQFISILAQGARTRGDLGCGAIERVHYAGFELPEFDTDGTRIWKYHPGTVAAAPIYQAITAVDQNADTLTIPGHGFVTGDPIAFHKRGGDVVLPSVALPNPYSVQWIPTHRKCMVWRVDNDKIKVLAQATGTPLESNAFNISGFGVNMDRAFAYKADALYFDATQGRPEFFSELDFTFSGLAYIEVNLPAKYSNGEDEPTRLKVLMNGKEVYGIQNIAGVLSFDTGVVSAEANPALVAVDVLINDAKLPFSRFNAATWVSWRDRCDETITWEGGNDIPAQLPASKYSLTNMTYDVALNRFTHGGGAGNGYAYSTTALSARYPAIEALYTGKNCSIYFSENNTPGDYHQQGAKILNGLLYVVDVVGQFELMPVSVGDRIKVAYENGVLMIYRNGIQLPLVNVYQEQRYQTYYVKIILPASGDTLDSVRVAPSGTDAIPRQVKRFTGGFVAIEPTPAAQVFETMVQLCPGCVWADIDGQIQIGTVPDRTPCFQFIYDPTDTVASNVAKITLKRRDAQITPNYYRFIYRDLDSPILAIDYVYVDRKARREATGNRLIDSGLFQFGVMTRSQMERIGETKARIESDLDLGFTVEGFLDSLPVVKGSFVTVVDQPDGYTQASPALCVVTDIRYNFSDVETPIYELQIITPDYYDDSSHGQVTPGTNLITAGKYAPPNVATSLTLSETSEPMPDGSYVSSISGEITFGTGFDQHARLFRKVLVTRIADVTCNGTDTFTVTDGVVPGTSTPLSLASTSNDLPAGATLDVPYYAVEIDGLNFKLSLTEGGAAVVFTDAGADLAIYSYVAWQDTGIDVFSENGIGAFEIIPARLSLTFVRAVTRSPVDASLSFGLHTTTPINVTGDLTPPEAPTDPTVTYDGVMITFSWLPSPTFGVTSYIVMDELDRFVAQFDGTRLTYAQTAQADQVTRRIYAVSSAGVLSQQYAEITWVRPVGSHWINVTGMTIGDNNTLTKTQTSGWGNAGAILDTALLDADQPPSIISGAPNNYAIRHAFGLSVTPNVDHYADMAYCLVIEETGAIRLYENGSLIGTLYEGETPKIGDRYFFEYEFRGIGVTPYLHVKSLRVRTARDKKKHLVYTFTNPVEAKYVATAIYTAAGVSNFDIQLSGNLIPSIGDIPDSAQNLTNATYNATNGTLASTGGTGWGSSGASVVGLDAGQDGGWYFKFSGNGAIGLNTEDTDDTADSIPMHIRIEEDNDAFIYHGATLIGAITDVSPTDTVFVGRINGIPVIRTSSGGSVETFSGAPDSLKNGAVILDTAFQHNVAPSTVSELLFFGGLTIQHYPEGGIIPVTITNLDSAYVGLNRADEIPKFTIDTPTAGQILGYNASLEVVNMAAPISGERVSEYAGFAEAVSAIGATPTTLHIDANANCSTPTVVPATLTIEQEGNFKITKTGTGSIEFEGIGVKYPMAGRPLFASFADGDVFWSGTEYPRWISSELFDTGNNSETDRVSRCNEALDGKSTTIFVFPRVMTSAVFLKDGHSLIFMEGVHENDYEHPQFLDYTPYMPLSNCIVEGMPNAILEQSSVFGSGGLIYTQDHAINVTIRNLYAKGIGTTFDGADSTFLIRNGTNCHIIDCVADDYPAYNFSILDTDGTTEHCSIRRTRIFGATSLTQNIACTGGEHIEISDNYILFKDYPTTVACTAIDVEPNDTGASLKHLKLLRNTIDVRNLSGGGAFTGITVQATNRQGLEDVTIADNTILANELYTSAGDLNTSGISLIGADGFDLARNYVQGLERYGAIATVQQSRRGEIHNNRSLAGNGNIRLIASQGNKVYENSNTPTGNGIQDTCVLEETSIHHAVVYRNGSVVRLFFDVYGSQQGRGYKHYAGEKVYVNTAPFTISSIDFSYINNIRLTLSGAPEILSVSKTIAPTDINTTTNEITITAHGWITGQPVVLMIGTTAPTPLTNDTLYYVIRIDDNTIKLAYSLANAFAGTAYDITDQGTGNHTLSTTAYNVASTSFNTTTNEITMTGHGLVTGATLYFFTGGTVPTGLTNYRDYWVIRVDNDKIKLANTYADAIAGTAVDFSTQGTNAHLLLPQVTVPSTDNEFYNNPLPDYATLVLDNYSTSIERSAPNPSIVAVNGSFSIPVLKFGRTYDNTNATILARGTLPSNAPNGAEYSFYVGDTVGMQIIASGGLKIRDGADLSDVNGFIHSATIGSMLTLKRIANEWVAKKSGTWNVYALADSTLIYKIDSGRTTGGTVDGVLQDTYYTGGSVASQAQTWNLSLVPNPLPDAVYDTIRYGYGSFQYDFTGLDSNDAHIIRLHFGVPDPTYLPTYTIMDFEINDVQVLDAYCPALAIQALIGTVINTPYATYLEFVVPSGSTSLKVEIIKDALGSQCLLSGIELYSVP